jgi:hypothetical protein
MRLYNLLSSDESKEIENDWSTTNYNPLQIRFEWFRFTLNRCIKLPNESYLNHIINVKKLLRKLHWENSDYKRNETYLSSGSKMWIERRVTEKSNESSSNFFKMRCQIRELYTNIEEIWSLIVYEISKICYWGLVNNTTSFGVVGGRTTNDPPLTRGDCLVVCDDGCCFCIAPVFPNTDRKKKAL